MSDPVKHHFLPKCYLRGFSGKDDVFWVYNRSRDHYSYKHPSAFGYERHLYSLPDYEGGFDYTLERAFKVVEDDYPDLIGRLERKCPIGARELDHLHAFATTMHARVRAMLTNIEQVANTVALPGLHRMFGSIPKIQRALDDFHAAHPDEEIVTVEDFKAFLDGVEGIITPHSKVLDLMLEITKDISAGLRLKRFTVLHAPKPKRFLTSDRPVVVQSSAPCGSPVGILSDDASIFLPLSSRCALLIGSDNEHQAHWFPTGAWINQLNVLTAKASFDHVVGQTESEVRAFVERSRIKGVAPADTIHLEQRDLEQVFADLDADGHLALRTVRERRMEG